MLKRQANFRAIGALGAVWTVCLALAGCASQSGVSGASRDDGENAAPRDANAALIGAEVALQRKQYALAAKTLYDATAASDDETLAQRAASVAYQHHQYEYALKSAQRWLQINESSEEAHRYAGFSALRLYRIELAATHFEALLNSTFISPAAGFMSLGPQWFEIGSRPGAQALLQRLIAKYGDVAEAHLVLGQAALQAENLALASSSARKAIELSPYWQPARSFLARVQLATGERDAALATAQSLVDQEGGAAQRLEHAQFMYAAGKEDEGRSALEGLADSEEVGAAAKRSLALIDAERGQLDSAAKRWRELVQSGRFVYEGLFYLGQIAERRGEGGDAIELLTRVTESDLAVPAQTRAALLKSRADGVDAGLAMLRKFGDERAGNEVEVAIAQATLLADLDRIPQGIAVLDAAIESYPDRDDLLVSKALLLERGGKSGDAIKAMRELARQRPDDPTVLNMLGYTLVDRTRSVDEGLTMIRRALDAMPDNGAILDSMGWALHRQKRHEEALPYLQRAHDRGADPEISLHLGEVLWALGRNDEARKTWEEALARAPDNEHLKTRLNKAK
jgi:tetratricopeptide (TPR) repeat protein